MSNRPPIRSAFDGLRPSIVREPSRAPIASKDETRLLETTAGPAPLDEPRSPDVLLPPEDMGTPQSVAFPAAPLLSKKKREVLVPVTFRIPQVLKERLNEIAKRYDLNQTDLINEGIELNLQRYR